MVFEEESKTMRVHPRETVNMHQNRITTCSVVAEIQALKNINHSSL